MNAFDREFIKFLDEIWDEYDPVITERKWREFKLVHRMKKFLKVGEYEENK
jgi:hypothetical protein